MMPNGIMNYDFPKKMSSPLMCTVANLHISTAV